MRRNEGFVALSAVLFAFGTASCRPSMPPIGDAGTDATDAMVTDMGMSASDVHTDGHPSQDTWMEAGARSVTIRQLQDIDDPMHPAPGSYVTLEQSGMVALTPRMLISSSGGECRWAAWIGSGTTGDFSGVQVQELVRMGDAGDCFHAPAGKIPADLIPGDRISAIREAQYTEFCAGPSGVDRSMCRNWEQTQLFVGTRNGQFVRAGTGSAPMPTEVAVSEIAPTTDGSLAPRTLALEGVLIRVSNVRVRTTMTDAGSVPDIEVFDSSDTTMARPLRIQVSNFLNTRCVRDYFVARNGMTVTSITGVFLPSFGRWTLRIRDENDVSGVTCTRGDGGVNMDAGRDM